MDADDDAVAEVPDGSDSKKPSEAGVSQPKPNDDASDNRFLRHV